MARRDYYNSNRERILARRKATYNREESTERHRTLRDRVYSDPERAAIYRKKRRDSVIRSLGRKAAIEADLRESMLVIKLTGAFSTLPIV